MATPTSPNPAQIAPGEEVGYIPPDIPYTGPAMNEHIGQMSLNESFSIGATTARQ